MFLVEVLALLSLLYRNRLALEVRIDDYRTLLHVANIIEVDVATFIRAEIDLIGLVDTIVIGLMVVHCLLAVVATKLFTTNELPTSVIG